MKDLLS